MLANDHLSSTDLTAFAASGLPDEARAAAEAHLSTCRACRRLLVAAHESAAARPDIPSVPLAVRAQVQRLVPAVVPAERPRPQPIEQSRPLWPSLLAAAALVAATVGWALLRNDRQTPEPPARIVRSGAALSLAPTLIEPVIDARVAAVAGRFRWSRVPDAVDYAVTVLDQQGDIVHEVSTAQPLLEGQPEAQLRLPTPPGKRLASPIYYWFVCARQTDGHESCSSVGQFVVE